MKKDKKQGDCKSCKHGQTGMDDGICRYCGIASMNWELKAKILNMEKVMVLMENHMICESCGSETFGSGRILMINEDKPGREFVPFHIICSCGHEVKIYD
ncbi:hypothetical protein [Acetobacterium malicum]|uniref:hypothetical protein n=1 Tax=Acetobacterium malicum TaxID=52692 RepID=UPI0035948732